VRIEGTSFQLARGGKLAAETDQSAASWIIGSEVLLLKHHRQKRERVVYRLHSLSCGCAASGEPGEAANQAGLSPPAAQPEGVARSDEGESDQDERIDEVIVHENVVLGRQRSAPHQDEQDRTASGGDAHSDAEQQRHGNAEQTDHEQPVHPACARDGLIKAREGAGGTAEEAKGGGSPIDPRVGGGGFVAKPEGLVQEWPQEGPAQAQPGDCPHVAGRLVVVDSAALIVVDSEAVSPATFLGVVTSIMYTFLGVKEKPVVPCDGVIDVSTLASHQCTHIGGFFNFSLSVKSSTHSLAHYAFYS
jgi:hypothetical protein